MDLINREQAIDIVDDIDIFCAGWRDNAISRIKALPTAEKTAEKTSMWLKTGQSLVDPHKFRNFFCPICGFELDKHIRIAPYYCSNCGARMVSDEDKH